MIFIDRTKVQAPNILIDPKKAGAKETAKAIEHYNNPGSIKTFNYKVYKDSKIKETLIKLFREKCAYCESYFLHVYSGDIEHFRPKAEIEEATPLKKPGYYWLAANWENLLLSCRNCNQKLKHSVYGIGTKKTMGKMNQFPLSDLTKYVRRHDNPNGIKDEEPFRLLLNPCVDKPELHLEYGDEGIIKPKKDIRGVSSIKGKISIDVYVLQRVYLVQAREKKLIDIQAQIQRVKEAVINYNEQLNIGDTTKRFFFEKILKRELEALKKFLSLEKEYLGMARQIIGEFLSQNFGIVDL